MTKSYQRSSLFTNAFTSDQGSYAKNLYLDFSIPDTRKKNFFKILKCRSRPTRDTHSTFPNGSIGTESRPSIQANQLVLPTNCRPSYHFNGMVAPFPKWHQKCQSGYLLNSTKKRCPHCLGAPGPQSGYQSDYVPVVATGV